MCWFFFFKQKTAYEMRISDWSSDVCSSDLPDGVGVHPLKLAFGYIRKARALGVKIHPASPVLGWETVGGVHHLRTPGGIVRARRVAVATGGYTPQGLQIGRAHV